jgi:hypothetical protein
LVVKSVAVATEKEDLAAQNIRREEVKAEMYFFFYLPPAL